MICCWLLVKVPIAADLDFCEENIAWSEGLDELMNGPKHVDVGKRLDHCLNMSQRSKFKILSH